MEAAGADGVCAGFAQFHDASVSACRAFADEDHTIADAAFSSLQTEQAVVPALWRFELRNILIVNERRGRIHERDTDFFLGR
jgi:hypothetical protein